MPGKSAQSKKKASGKKPLDAESDVVVQDTNKKATRRSEPTVSEDTMELVSGDGAEGEQGLVLSLAKVKSKLGEEWSSVVGDLRQKLLASIPKHISNVTGIEDYGNLGYMITSSHPDSEALLQGASQLVDETVRSIFGVRPDAPEIEVFSADNAPPPISETDEEMQAEAAFATSLRENVRQKAILTGVDYIYWPIWDTQLNAIIQYRQEPMIENASGEQVFGYAGLGKVPHPEVVAHMDQSNIEVADREIAALLRTGKRLHFMVPVHFLTLDDHQRFLKFRSKCLMIPQSVRENIKFEIIGLPAEMNSARASQFVSALRALAPSVVLCIDSVERNISQAKGSGVNAVSVNVHGSEDEERLIRLIEIFAERAEREGLRSLVHGIDTVSLATAALAAGVNLMDGAVLGNTRAPRQGFEFRPESLYGMLLDGI